MMVFEAERKGIVTTECYGFRKAEVNLKKGKAWR